MPGLVEESLDDENDAGPEAMGEVTVLSVNLPSITAFQLCPIEGVGAGFGVEWIGIGPAAIRSAILLLRLPRDTWATVAADVRYMGECVAIARNRRIRAAAKH